MINISINGRLVQAEEGEFLLTVMKRNGFKAPALCHHEAVEPYGGCRLCMVEISKPQWKGWKDLVVSCLYPVSADLEVQTDSEAVIQERKTVLHLLLARNPHTKEIKDLAAEYGIVRSKYQEVAEPDDCILCAICTRICDAMGFSAISLVNRGHGREVAPPLNEPPPDCTGCLACALNCPTNYIKYTDNGMTREIWGKTFEMLRDPQTGKPTITRVFAEYLTKHREIPEEYFGLGDESHRKRTAKNFGKIAAWTREATTQEEAQA
jgi:NADH dehydrogenase/NADH:ubiquinone oxidoreductase subunit G